MSPFQKLRGKIQDSVISRDGSKKACLLTLTDRDKEFAKRSEVTETLSVDFCFPPSHYRGTNESISGSLREYFPKGRILLAYKIPAENFFYFVALDLTIQALKSLRISIAFFHYIDKIKIHFETL